MLSILNIAISVVIVLYLIFDGSTIEQSGSDETQVIQIETKADLIREHNRIYRDLGKRFKRTTTWESEAMLRQTQVLILSELRLLMEEGLIYQKNSLNNSKETFNMKKERMYGKFDIVHTCTSHTDTLWKHATHC